MAASEVGRERATFEAMPTGPRAARAFTEAALARGLAPVEVIRDFTLVVSELVTNFVEHSDGSPIEVLVDVASGPWWDVEVVGGAGVADKNVPRPDTWSLAADEQISGRGLGIVRRLMDDVTVEVSRRRVSVHCRRLRLPADG